MNKDYAKRDVIVFGNVVDWDGKTRDVIGGIKYFRKMEGNTLRKLFDEDFIDPEERQNYAPTAKEFLELITKYPNIKVSGYVVSPQRDDYRITIEEIIIKGKISYEERLAFTEFSRCSDDSTNNKGYMMAWWG